MISLKQNNEKTKETINLNECFLLNIELINNKKLIKKIIKYLDKSYKINNTFFEVLNNYVEVDANNNSLYGGLIIRTNFDDYAVIYLKDSLFDEEYMLKVINEYIYDIADHYPQETNISMFEIDIETFLSLK